MQGYDVHTICLRKRDSFFDVMDFRSLTQRRVAAKRNDRSAIITIDSTAIYIGIHPRRLVLKDHLIFLIG